MNNTFEVRATRGMFVNGVLLEDGAQVELSATDAQDLLLQGFVELVDPTRADALREAANAEVLRQLGRASRGNGRGFATTWQ